MMRSLRLALAISFCSFSCLALAQVPNTHPLDGIRNPGIDTIALEKATVVTQVGKKLDGITLLIRDGKIIGLGKGLTIPAGTKRIDLQGKTIYPGWIDSYSEVDVTMPDNAKGAPYWNSNIVPQRCTADTYQATTDQWAKYRKAGITSVLAVPSGGIIRGTSSVVATNDQPAEKAILASRVADHVRLTVSFGFRGAGGYPTSPMGAVALARQAFLDADWYRKAWQAYNSQPNLPQPELNAALQALVDLSVSNRPVMMDALNEQYALRADQFAREMSLPIILHGSGREYRLLDRIAALNRAMVIPVNFPKAPNVSTTELSQTVPLQDLMHWELSPENPARLINAGVKVAFTAEGLEDPADLRSQLRIAIEHGLSPDDALQSLTMIPAELLGIDHLVGSIAVGKWANLIVTNGEIFNEKTKIEETWVQGTRFRWTEEKSLEVQGTWELELVGNQGKPEKLEMVLEGDKKLSGSLRLPSATANPSSEESKLNVTGADSPEPSKKEEPDQPPSPVDPTASQPAADTQDTHAEKSKQEEKKERKKTKDGSTLDKLTLADARLSAIFQLSSLLAKKDDKAKEQETDHANDGFAHVSLVFLHDSQSQESERLPGTWLGTIHWPDGTTSSVTAKRKPEATPDNTPSQSKEGKPTDNPKAIDDAKSQDDTKKKSETAADARTKKILSQANYPLGEFGRSGHPQQSEWLLVKNAQLWTCGAEGTMQQTDMLIHHGIIAEIGRGLKAPEGAVILDAAGKHVTPGIIDCHSHMATDGGVNEAGQSVTAEVRVGDFIDATDYTIYCQLAGGVTTANILHGSANPIGGQNQVIKLRWGGVYDDLKMKEAPGGIKFALGENVKQSNRSEPGDRYPQSRMGVEQILRDRFEAAKEYDKQWKTWQRDAKGLPPRRDLEMEAIAEILHGERWIHCHSYRQDEILATLRVLEEYHVTIGSLQHILEGYKVAEAMAKHGATGSSFSDWWAYKYEVIDAIPYNGAIMHNMGITVSFNSDDNELGRHLNHEAAKAMKYGNVPPAEALQFVTLNPAKQLRIDRWVGSLEVGKHADFVVWNSNPLSAMTRCEQTWIDGRKYFDREADQAERHRVATLHRQLVQKVLTADGPMGKPGERDLDASTLWPRHDEFCHHHHDDDDHLHQEATEEEEAHDHR